MTDDELAQIRYYVDNDYDIPLDLAHVLLEELDRQRGENIRFEDEIIALRGDIDQRDGVIDRLNAELAKHRAWAADRELAWGPWDDEAQEGQAEPPHPRSLGEGDGRNRLPGHRGDEGEEVSDLGPFEHDNPDDVMRAIIGNERFDAFEQMVADLKVRVDNWDALYGPKVRSADEAMERGARRASGRS